MHMFSAQVFYSNNVTYSVVHIHSIHSDGTPTIMSPRIQHNKHVLDALLGNTCIPSVLAAASVFVIPQCSGRKNSRFMLASSTLS